MYRCNLISSNVSFHDLELGTVVNRALKRKYTTPQKNPQVPRKARGARLLKDESAQNLSRTKQ